MTERDRKLLALLFAFLSAVAVFRWMIKPALQDRQILGRQMEEALREEKNRAERLGKTEELEEVILRREAELETLSAPYGGYLPTEEIDRMVTELFVRHGLTPRSLSVTEGVTGVLRDYRSEELSRSEQEKYGAPYEDISLKEYLETTADTVDVSDVEALGRAYLYIASVRMEAEGTEEAFLGLLDDLEENMQQIRVRGFSLTEGKIHCEMDVYFCGK